MKKNPTDADTPKKEYDFRGGTRGKYAAEFAKGTNIVVLDDDVAEVFPDSDSVNEALRALRQVIERHSGQPRSR